MASLSFADESATAGRQVLQRYQNAVITVKLILKQGMSYNNQDSKTETKSETTGTIIDPSGLTIISLSAIDPSGPMNELFRMRSRSGSGAEMKYESELTDIKLVLPDGIEIAAEVVLRDKDLDLAYIHPVEKPSSPLLAVDLAPDNSPQVLDPVVILSRLGQVANRMPTAALARVEAVVEKPRRCYVFAQGNWNYGLGSPVFSLEGRLIGVIVLRTLKSEGDAAGGGFLANPSVRGIMPIIVPTRSFLDGVKQALEAAKIPRPAAKGQ
jgi:hypothetical protein